MINNDVKTSIAGGIAGACQIAGFFIPAAHVLCDPISALALMVMGWFTNKADKP